MVFTSFEDIVSLQKIPCATRKNPRYTRDAHSKGDLLIHRYRGPPSPLEKAIR